MQYMSSTLDHILTCGVCILKCMCCADDMYAICSCISCIVIAFMYVYSVHV